ncbi:MAG: glyoxalase [Alphaproteobacteria bacterium]|nr:glyoxalase [Alphaproteobacteria bacterium]
MRIRGQEIPYSMDTAICWSGKVMWELIEPLDGPTIYEEFLEAHGEGIHHVQGRHNGFDYEEHVNAFAERGYSILMEGNYEGAKFAYLDTEDPLKTIIEIRGVPEDWVRPEPDSWYPAPPEARSDGA